MSAYYVIKIKLTIPQTTNDINKIINHYSDFKKLDFLNSVIFKWCPVEKL